MAKVKSRMNRMKAAGISSARTVCKIFGHKFRCVGSGKTRIKIETLRQGMTNTEAVTRVTKQWKVFCPDCDKTTWLDYDPTPKHRKEAHAAADLATSDNGEVQN
jgi:hypothetical protein